MSRARYRFPSSEPELSDQGVGCFQVRFRSRYHEALQEPHHPGLTVLSLLRQPGNDVPPPIGIVAPGVRSRGLGAQGAIRERQVSLQVQDAQAPPGRHLGQVDGHRPAHGVADHQKPIVPACVEQRQRDFCLTAQSERGLLPPRAHPESGDVRDHHLTSGEVVGGHELGIGESGIPEPVQTQERRSPAAAAQVVHRCGSFEHTVLQTVLLGQVSPEGDEVVSSHRDQLAGASAAGSERRLRSAAKNRIVSTTTPMARV